MKNWYEHKEKTKLGYKLMLFMLKAMPSALMRAMAFPIGFFYFLSAREAKKSIKTFLENLKSFSNSKFPKFFAMKNIISFSLNLVENVQSWAGKLDFSNLLIQENEAYLDFQKNVEEKKGLVLVISHLGNPQMLRGIILGNKNVKINTIMDLQLSAGFHSLLKKINPDSSIELINASDFGPETIIMLQEKISNGEIVVIAGDRKSAKTEKFVESSFLGKTAGFPYGVFLMVALLNAPTYFMTALRKKDLSIYPQYEIFFKKNEMDFDCPRKERESRIIQSVKTYVQNLETLCVKKPLQWYNFFDFWS